MKFTTSSVIALVAGLASAPVAAQYNTPAPSAPPRDYPSAQQPTAPTTPGQAQIKVSSKAAKAIMDLQASVKANDFASVPAKVAAAQAVAQTKDDRYAIAQLQLTAAVAAKDNNAAAAAADSIAASGFLPPSKVADLYDAVGVQLFNAKQFPQAVTLFQKSSSLNPQNAEPLKHLAEALNSQGNRAGGAAALNKALQISAANGQKPEEALYKRALGMAYEAKAPDAVDLGRQWIMAYPSPESWRNGMAVYRNLNNPDPATLIDILRLARATNSLEGTGDFHAYAYEAANEANYGEAKSLVAEGLASGKIKASDPIVQEIQRVLKSKATPTAAELAAAEKGASVPTAFLRVGDRYYGAGNYAKAADLYRQALAKGADKNVANLRLGEALARSGDKAGATAAFNAVGGSLADVAKFWLIYLRQA